MYVLLPLFGVAVRGNATLTILLLHWLFRTRETLIKCDVTPVLALTRFTHVTFFCCPFLPLLGVLSVVKATLRLLPLVIPYSGTLRYDITLVLALLFFLHKYMSILLPLFITPFGVAVRGKGKLTILALISPYSENPKVRHVSDFNLGSFT